MPGDLDPLPRAVPYPTGWQVECPACGAVEDIEMDEDISGAFGADGPDMFPVCQDCQTQFAVASVHVVEGGGDADPS